MESTNAEAVSASGTRPDPKNADKAGSGPVHSSAGPSAGGMVLAVASNKGGVGKTTVAANLALYVRALSEDLPVLVIGLDDQRTLDRTFALRPLGPGEPGLEEAWAAGSLNHAIRLGQYGIHFIASPRDGKLFKQQVRRADELRSLLRTTGFDGLTVIDTKSDLEILTENALTAAHRVIVPVSDRASLAEAERLFARIDELGGDRDCARVLVTLADRRTRVAGGGTDLLALLQAEIDRRGFPRYESFLSRSPSVEALLSASERPQTILHAARGTALHRQMGGLAREVMRDLALTPARSYPSARKTSESGAGLARADESVAGLREAGAGKRDPGAAGAARERAAVPPVPPALRPPVSSPSPPRPGLAGRRPAASSEADGGTRRWKRLLLGASQRDPSERSQPEPGSADGDAGRPSASRVLRPRTAPR